MKYFLICSLFMTLFACTSKKEELQVIKENDFIQIDLKKYSDNSGKGFLVYYPLDAMEDSTRSQIVFPDLSEVKDTAYANVWFTGGNEGAMENVVLMIIGDYGTTSPKIWIDDNNDLEFTADELFYVFKDDSLNYYIPNIHNENLRANYSLIKPVDSIYLKMNKMIGEYSTGGTHLGFFWEVRKDLALGDFIYKGDSMRIGVFDKDTDGSFNTLGEDRLVTGEFGKNVSTKADYQGAQTLDTISYFNSKNYGFQVLEITADGRMMKIKPLENKKVFTQLVVGDTLPDFILKNVLDDSSSIYAGLESQKYIYLNFWASWCGGCKQEVPDLITLNENYGDKVFMVSINYKQDTETVKLFMNKYQMTWINKLSSQEIIDILNVEGMPRNVLLDQSGKILDMNIRPNKLIDMLEND